MVTRFPVRAPGTRTRCTAGWGAALALFAATAAAQQPVEHTLDVTLEPADGRIVVRDFVKLTAGLPTELRFSLNAGLSVRIEERGIALTAADITPESKHLRQYTVTVPPAKRRFTLRYEGQLAAQEAQSENSAVISGEGVYLDDQSGWYPIFDNQLLRFKLSVHLPSGWDAVSQGKRGPETRTGRGTTVVWEERAPQQAIHLVAAWFHRYVAPLPGAEALVYLREPDRKLADTYLAATRRYIALYSRLLGPYPYAKFALVEHFRQTGLGMPSFTLLGSRVIRLPFIPETSYPHEILHNWWANGVYVDYASGNWSEGLTTYLADYLQAEEAGHGSVYRRDQLARYAAYARGMSDFALKDFHGRHNEATQAVGYGKGLMFFHMLRRRLGDAGFLKGLRTFYTQQRFRIAGYAALRAAMEQASGQKLEAFFSQWVARIGSPQLALDDVELREQDGRFHVHGLLRQTQRDWAYRLDVPLVLERANMPPFETAVHMSTRQLRFDIAVEGRPLRVAIDPRFDLFRRPLPAELPASFGEVFGADRVTVVLPSAAASDLHAAYDALATNWVRRGIVVRRDDQIEELPVDRAVWLFGWDNRWRAALAPDTAETQIEDDAVTLDGARYPRNAHSLALVLRRNQQPLAWLAADDPQAIARLARAVPHYGGKSYVVFANDPHTTPLSGQWQVTQSPLQRALAADISTRLDLPPRPALTATVK
jgi:hypothetical protein